MRSHRLFNILFKTFVTGLLTLVILIGAILGRLYLEPIDLAFLTPRLEAFLQEESESVQISLKDPQLRWQGLGHSLEIFAQNLTVQTSQETGLTANIPHFYLTFRFRNLLQAQFLPSILTLEKPKITYHPQQVLRDKRDTSVQNDELTSLFLSLFESSNRSKILKRLRIVKADLSLDLGEKGGVWRVPEFTFILNRKQGFIDGFCDFSFEKDQKISLSYTFLPQEQEWKLALEMASFDLPYWAQKPHLADRFPRGLKNSDLKITGQINLTLAKSFLIQKMQFSYSSEKGVLILEDSLPAPLPFQDFKSEGRFTPQDGLTSTLGFGLQKSPTQIEAKATLTPSQSEAKTLSFWTQFDRPFDLDGQATLHDLSLDQLPKLWPEAAAPPARSWLIQNLHQGHIPKATFHLSGALQSVVGSQQDLPAIFELKTLGGKIDLERGTLRYYDTMPVVTDLSAQAHYDQNHFSISMTKGTCGGLSLSNGLVTIQGFQADTQNIEIQTKVKGPLSAALTILNQEPLTLLKETTLDPHQTTGDMEATVSLKFPLDDPIATEDFRYRVEASVVGATLPRPLAFLPVSLSDSNLSIKVTNDQMTVSGGAHLNRIPSQLFWHRSLKKESPKEQVKAHFAATPSFLKSLGVPTSPLVKGALPSTVIYDRLSSDKSTLKVQVDLSPGRLQLGPWLKKSRQAGKLVSTWHFDKGQLRRLAALSVTAPDLMIEASADFKEDLSFKSVALKTFKWGQSDLKGTLSQGKDVDYKVFLEGDFLDLGGHLKSLKDETSGDFKISKQIDVRLRINKILLSQKQSFYQNSLSLRFLNDRVHSAAYKGYLDPTAQKEFYIDLLPRSNNGRRLRLKCQDAGYMLKALNFFDDVAEGKLKLTANQTDDAPGAPWEGKLEIQSFWLEKAPIISRVLSLAFPTGLVSAFSEKGLSFDRLKVKFKKKGSLVSLYRGRAYSPSFGFSLKGAIKNNFSDLNLQGTVYPAYFFNTFLSRIPFLGQILTGGKHEGIWGVSYTITGPSDKPDISVNPLTAFTPGIFRKIFLPSDEDETDMEDDDEDAKESVLEK